jgi:hypothetical protein
MSKDLAHHLNRLKECSKERSPGYMAEDLFLKGMLQLVLRKEHAVTPQYALVLVITAWSD